MNLRKVHVAGNLESQLRTEFVGSTEARPTGQEIFTRDDPASPIESSLTR